MVGSGRDGSVFVESGAQSGLVKLALVGSSVDRSVKSFVGSERQNCCRIGRVRSGIHRALSGLVGYSLGWSGMSPIG